MDNIKESKQDIAIKHIIMAVRYILSNLTSPYVWIPALIIASQIMRFGIWVMCITWDFAFQLSEYLQ